jgi:hypothetical protein
VHPAVESPRNADVALRVAFTLANLASGQRTAAGVRPRARTAALLAAQRACRHARGSTLRQVGRGHRGRMRRGGAPHSRDRDAGACSVVEFSGGGKGPAGSVVGGGMYRRRCAESADGACRAAAADERRPRAIPSLGPGSERSLAQRRSSSCSCSTSRPYY